MSVSTFLGLASFSKLAGPSDDDAFDRLNHLYTVVVLVIFSFAGTGSQFIGSPMDCLMPPEFPYTYMSYAKSYCWIKNTYFIPLDTAIPVDVVEREQAELTYYQWVPIILLFMALLFKMPCIVWRVITRGYSVNLDKVTAMIMSLDVGPEEKRKDTVVMICQYLDRWLSNRRQSGDTTFDRFHKRFFKMICVFGGKREGTYLTGLYMVTKLLYVANVIGQFFLLNTFMGDWYALYGFEVIRDMMNGKDLRESHRFPHMTLCDFQMRQFENIQRWTVQCVLPINLFNDKIFLFLWCWLCMVTVLTVLSFALWVYRICFRTAYVKKYLATLEQLKDDEGNQYAKAFARDYLCQDGVFILRLVSKNTNDLLVSEVFVALFKHYKEKQKKKDDENKGGKDKTDEGGNDENDKGGNVENDKGGNVENDKGGNDENDKGGNVENDKGGNVENNKGGKVENDKGANVEKDNPAGDQDKSVDEETKTKKQAL